MKTKSTLLFLFIVFAQLSSGQITDEEARLRKKNNDSIQGWKQGGDLS